jgi:transcriptional regulator with XRE-family HTH domain
MRVLRIKNHEVMGDVAKILNVSVPFLSAVENGKKNVPSEWLEKISNHYNLDEAEYAELKKVVEQSKTQMKMDLTSATLIQRTVALQFARSFDNMDENTAKKIIELLEKNGGASD